jgi:hypothetical protein
MITLRFFLLPDKDMNILRGNYNYNAQCMSKQNRKIDNGE